MPPPATRIPPVDLLDHRLFDEFGLGDLVLARHLLQRFHGSGFKLVVDAYQLNVTWRGNLENLT